MEDTSLDDCYFYFYSTCSKGDSCPFRHCEAALGTETVCSLWKEGRCFRQTCKYRHMESNKHRSSIQCYWESQPGGCRKPHCVFWHMRSHLQKDGVAVSATCEKDAISNDVTLTESDITREDLQNDALTQLASPVIEPVVVRFDEESDSESYTGTPIKMPPLVDQGRLMQKSSEMGEKKRRIISLKKSEDVQDLENKELNFHIKSLAEIRKEKVQNPVVDKSNLLNENNSNKILSGPEADIPESKEKCLTLDKFKNEPVKRKFDEMGKSEEPTSIKDRILTRARLEQARTNEDASVITHVFDKPRNSNQNKIQSEGKRKSGPGKRKISLKSPGNVDLQNVQVKTLEQIRAEKRMKLSMECKQQIVDEQPIVTSENKETRLENDTQNDQPSTFLAAPSVNKQSEELKPSPLKKLRLRYLKHNNPETQTFQKEDLTSSSIDQQQVVESSNLKEKVDSSESIEESVSHIKQTLDIVGLEEARVLPQKLDSSPAALPMQIDNVTSVLSSRIESPSEVQRDVPKSTSMPIVNASFPKKKASSDDDLYLLFEGDADVCLDDTDVELKDDDILRELDEAIK